MHTHVRFLSYSLVFTLFFSLNYLHISHISHKTFNGKLHKPRFYSLDLSLRVALNVHAGFVVFLGFVLSAIANKDIKSKKGSSIQPENSGIGGAKLARG